MYIGLLTDRNRKYFLFLFATIVFIFISIKNGYSQYGIISGTIKDGSDNMPLSGVVITKDSIQKNDSSLAAGKYVCRFIDGTHTIYFKYPGYQTKIIKNVTVQANQITHLDIILYPISNGHLRNNIRIKRDSAGSNETIFTNTFKKETQAVLYNVLHQANTINSHIDNSQIAAGTDKNTALLLNRLHGVVINNNPVRRNNQHLFINGFGQRYNQVLFNGAVMNSTDYNSRAFPLEALPVEAIESVSLHTMPGSFLPADFVGGTVAIRTKDIPEKNFYLLQVGGGFNNGTRGETFFGDKRNGPQNISFPGSLRNLPSNFPTTRSQSVLHEKNLQEQYDLAKLLPNNLGPVNYGKSGFDNRILAGFGKTLHYKNGLTVGILAFLNHSKEQLINQSTTQVSPDIRNNPFPFDATKKLIRSQSQDDNHSSFAQLSGTLNVSFHFRKNKISIRNYIGNQLTNILSFRNNIVKPDEDTLANSGIRYFTEQKQFWYTQVAGEHSLGEKGKFHIDWQATYNHQSQQNPDERNFLLRRSANNDDLYELAQQQSPELDRTSIFPGPVNPTIDFSQMSNFTNTSRLWRSSVENNFTASFNIKVPINIANHPQSINGGLYMQNVNRKFVSDLFLVQGNGYTTLDNLLSPNQYFPGGLSITNFYSNTDRTSGFAPNYINRANYISNQNVGGSYLYFENHFFKNLFVNWGLRLESANLTSAIVQYEYVQGFRYPQKFSIDDNLNQVDFTVLPAAAITWKPHQKLHINAAYSRTVNRPQLQELNTNYYYDASNFLVQSGNPNLRTALVDNYNLGAAWLPDAHSFIKLNAFYKSINQPIENIILQYPFSIGNMFVAPYNLPGATIQGLQANINWSLNSITSNKWASAISFFASGTFMQSKVEEGPVRSLSIGRIRSHNLSETPTYTFNAGIIVQQLNAPELSVVYNQTGDYISKIGSGQLLSLSNGNLIATIPDYRIKTQRQLNVQAAQRFLKTRLQVIAGVTNLLKDPFIEYQDLNGNEKYDQPLIITSGTSGYGFYRSGTDNTVLNIKTQSAYYLRLSWLF